LDETLSEGQGWGRKKEPALHRPHDGKGKEKEGGDPSLLAARERKDTYDHNFPPGRRDFLSHGGGAPRSIREKKEGVSLAALEKSYHCIVKERKEKWGHQKHGTVVCLRQKKEEGEERRRAFCICTKDEALMCHPDRKSEKKKEGKDRYAAASVVEKRRKRGGKIHNAIKKRSVCRLLIPRG